MIEPIACPFCGSDATRPIKHGLRYFYVICSKCEAQGPMTIGEWPVKTSLARAKAQCVIEWNQAMRPETPKVSP